MSRSDSHRLADMLMAAEEITSIVSRGRAAFDDDVGPPSPEPLRDRDSAEPRIDEGALGSVDLGDVGEVLRIASAGELL